MKVSNNIPDFALLAKYLAGEASVAEIAEVEVWINSGNRDEFEQIKNIWLSVDNAEINFDTDNAYKNLDERISYHEPKKNNRFISLISIAAVIIVLAVSIVVINFVGNKPQANFTAYASSDSVSNGMLADGSEVFLNKNTKIEYGQDFTNARIVKLSGEACFEVRHVSSDNKFIVKASALEISVVGTKFVVSDYEDLENIEVVVAEGVVRVNHENWQNEIEVVKGEKLIFNRNSGSTSISEYKFNTDMFWLTNTIVFDDSGIEEVASTLSSIYDVNIIQNVSNPEDLKINTSFENTELDEILKILCLTLDISVERKGDTIVINDTPH